MHVILASLFCRRELVRACLSAIKIPPTNAFLSERYAQVRQSLAPVPLKIISDMLMEPNSDFFFARVYR